MIGIIMTRYPNKIGRLNYSNIGLSPVLIEGTVAPNFSMCRGPMQSKGRQSAGLVQTLLRLLVLCLLELIPWGVGGSVLPQV